MAVTSPAPPRAQARWVIRAGEDEQRVQEHVAARAAQKHVSHEKGKIQLLFSKGKAEVQGCFGRGHVCEVFMP